MNQGFFNTSELQNVSSGGSRSRKCGACKLSKNCSTPKMEASGEGRKKILIIAEAPGGMEDKQGIRDVGKPGRYLKKTLQSLGIDLEEDCRKITAVNCKTEKGKKPTDLEIDCCRPMVYKEIDQLKPKLIILLGTSAIKSFYGEKWKKSIGGIEKWRGWAIPDRECKAWVCPAFHPSFVQKEKNPATEVIFKRDLRKAIRLLRKDLPQFKDEASCVEIIKRPSQIEKKLKDIYTLYNNGGLIAFDYETTGLKPNAKGHKLISCSIATGPIDCYSFPIFKENIPILRRILENPSIKKSAHDLKFETRWSYFKAHANVKGWFWDSQLAAHIIDNRRSSTSLKFQALINFGLLDYDSHISHFLAGVEEKNANSLNRIEELPIDDVLLYGGIDSIIGYRLTELQLPIIERRYKEAFQLFLEGNISLGEAEKYGMAVDEEYCQRKDKHLARQIKRLREEIDTSHEIKKWKKKFGKKYNPESNDQLAALLFDNKSDGGLGLECIKETANGNPSTDQEALESLDFPFIKKFLEVKKLIKIKSTNFGGFLRETVKGVLRPFFHLNRVITFRSSSSNINFQNIPNRIEWIKKLCRKAIIARVGRMIMGTDYGGIEVKVAYCYHKDPNMGIYLHDPTTDMHRDQAMEIFLLEEDEMTKPIRYTGKNGFVFPEFYGDYFGNCAKACWSNIRTLDLKTKSGVGLKTHLKKKGITTFDKFLNHMEEVERKFWEDKFSVYNQWKKDWVKAYHEKGYCDSLTGFRFQGLMQENDIINYPVQGAAFHCLVWSINEITKLIQEWESKFIGQIHDEKVDEVDPLELNSLVKLTDRVMCHDIKEHWDWIIVPLEAEFQITGLGESFYDKQELHKFKHSCKCKTEFCWKREESNYVVYTCPICKKEDAV